MISFISRMLKTRTGRVLTNSGFIAVVLGVSLFYILDFSQEPYVFDVQREEIQTDPSKRLYTYYADLNLDGHEERFFYTNGIGGNAYILVYKDGVIPLDQWNFPGSLESSSTGYFVGNYDHDRSMEIACFSLKGRSIYLNIVEPYGDSTHLVQNRLVDTIWTSDFNFVLTIDGARFVDINRDGSDELLFIASVGNARQPRNLYAYDIQADSLWSSPLSGICYRSPVVLDFDRDGRNEIFCETGGSNNYPKGGISYPDTSSYFVLLNDRLQYKVPPLPSGGLFSTTSTLQVEKDGKPALYVLVRGENNLESYSKWYTVNPDLSLIRANPFPNHPGLQVGKVFKSSSGINQLFLDPSLTKSLFIVNGMISDSVVNKSLKSYLPIYNYQAGIPQFEYTYSVGGERDALQFVNKNGRKLAVMKLNYSDEEYRTCWADEADGRPQLLLTSLKYHTWFSVRPNPWQYWQYLILIGIIGSFFGFITFVRFIQSQQFARQESMRKEVLELQLKTVRNQLDPHFTFNALNALSALSTTGDTRGVDQFIGHFSRLLRIHLNTSDQVLVSLRDEIEFVVNYVELQRIRFENAFRMELEVSKDIDLDRKVPKMLVQTHVENAIKHGLRPKADLGVVKVTIAEGDQGIRIVIEDNGVGRGHSTVSTFESTGKGLKALGKIIVSVKQLYGMEIRQEFADLTDQEEKPAGTRVTIEIDR